VAPVLVIPSSTLPGMIISFHVLKALVSLLSVRSPYIGMPKNELLAQGTSRIKLMEHVMNRNRNLLTKVGDNISDSIITFF